MGGFKRVEARLKGIEKMLHNQEKTIVGGFLEQKLAKPDHYAKMLARAQSYLAHAGSKPSKVQLCPFEEKDLLLMEISFAKDSFQKLSFEVATNFGCQQMKML